MDIVYKETKEFTCDQLQELFLSVQWASGQYPQKLVAAMKNYSQVYSAWEGETLIGLLCAMDDKVMVAYIHYVLVNPTYQGTGVGKSLMDMAKAHYGDYLRIVLISYDHQIGFYERCGFSTAQGQTPMSITCL